jgi:isopenicillin N synthase-like dioxygenase
MKEIVPVINASQLDAPDSLRALDMACRNRGIFQIIEHGIDQSVLDRVFECMGGFFSQSTSEKRKIERTGDNPWGFYDRELTKNTPDWKEVYDFGPADGALLKPQWPRHPQGFESVITEFYDACEVLAFKLLGAIALNLGVQERSLDVGFQPGHTSFLRLNYYPTCPGPSGPAGGEASDEIRLGINAHTDAGALTILLHGRQTGLQVFHHGLWETIEANEGSLLVNIGDIVQVWSNDRYAAPLHRVFTSMNEVRFSAPFFFNPSYKMNYQPLESTVSSGNPARYRPVNWGDFRSQRALGDYGDYGEEVQVEQYRLPLEGVT